MKHTLEIRNTLLSKFSKFRNEGHNIKQSSSLVGVTEKTGGVYEKLRKEKNTKKITEIKELITRLKSRADNPEISIKELIDLTNKLESLFIKKEKLTDQF